MNTTSTDTHTIDVMLHTPSPTHTIYKYHLVLYPDSRDEGSADYVLSNFLRFIECSSPLFRYIHDQKGLVLFMYMHN